VARRGARVEGVDQLRDALGRVKARLAITPEQVAAGGA